MRPHRSGPGVAIFRSVPATREQGARMTLSIVPCLRHEDDAEMARMTVAEELAKLDALPGWTWDALASRTEDYLDELNKFYERYGHAKVPVTFETSSGVNLGKWVSELRSNRDKLDNDLIAKLEKLDGWVWDTRDLLWDAGFKVMIGC